MNMSSSCCFLVSMAGPENLLEQTANVTDVL